MEPSCFLPGERPGAAFFERKTMNIVDERKSNRQIALGDVRAGKVVVLDDHVGFWIRCLSDAPTTCTLLCVETTCRLCMRKSTKVTLVKATVTIQDM